MKNRSLDDYDSYDLIWATVKYDELLQSVVQNIILVERKYWQVLLCDSSNLTCGLYFEHRDWLLFHHVIDEDELRKEVIKRVHE